MERRPSVYFCHRASGELALIIYEVRNTFGDIRSYVLPVPRGELSEAGVRQQQQKLFYVSPFIEMAMRYHFRVTPPGDRVRLRILEIDREGLATPGRNHYTDRTLPAAGRKPEPRERALVR